MKKLKKKYLDILEKQDWRVCDYTDDGRVEIEKYSPAGEDFILCVDVENFPDAVAEYYDNFDIDEHIEMWVEAKRNGTGGVPSVRRLAIDAEAIDDMLKELAYALKGGIGKCRYSQNRATDINVRYSTVTAGETDIAAFTAKERKSVKIHA